MQKKQQLWSFFAHAGIIIGMMFVVFFVIDRFNPAMEFLTSALSKWLILLLALLAIGNGLYSAVLLFQRQKRQEEKKISPRASLARGQETAVRQRAGNGYDQPSERAPRAHTQMAYDRGYAPQGAPYRSAESQYPRSNTTTRR